MLVLERSVLPSLVVFEYVTVVPSFLVIVFERVAAAPPWLLDEPLAPDNPLLGVTLTSAPLVEPDDEDRPEALLSAPLIPLSEALFIAEPEALFIAEPEALLSAPPIIALLSAAPDMVLLSALPDMVLLSAPPDMVLLSALPMVALLLSALPTVFSLPAGVVSVSAVGLASGEAPGEAIVVGVETVLSTLSLPPRDIA